MDATPVPVAEAVTAPVTDALPMELISLMAEEI
jgi:hypothetical protein